MPSFDVVSEIDMHEATNAIDQANREIGTRFDFKGTNSTFEVKDVLVTMTSETDFQLKQMLDILREKLTKRKIDISCMDVADAIQKGKESKQEVTLRQGLDSDLTRKIVKLIKEKKMKVQAQVQGEKVRVVGKKRDDLQAVMSLLRESKLAMPVQFNNFRD